MDDLTSDEYGTVDKLRNKLENILPPNMYEDINLFYRFLKARDFELDAAESMLRKHLTWRRMFQYDSILEDFKPSEVFIKYIDPSIIGFSKDRSLFVYIPCGKVDTGEVYNCMSMHKYFKHWAWVFAKALKYIRDRSNKIDKNTFRLSVIFDCENLSFSNATNRKTSELYLGLTNMLQNNFPETMKAMYVINAPAIAMVIIRIVKAVMTSDMQKKIHIYGYTGWKEKFLHEIEVDILPAFLGGKRTDPDGDPLCKDFMIHGGKIPSKYYLTYEEKCIKHMPGLRKVTIPSSGKKEICIQVDEKGNLIQWGFICKNNIGFGLFHESPDEKREEIIPAVKYDTSDRAEKDYYITKSAGKYIIVFDNSHSWLTSKDVEYYVEVLKPEIT